MHKHPHAWDKSTQNDLKTKQTDGEVNCEIYLANENANFDSCFAKSNSTYMLAFFNVK